MPELTLSYCRLPTSVVLYINSTTSGRTNRKVVVTVLHSHFNVENDLSKSHPSVSTAIRMWLKRVAARKNLVDRARQNVAVAQLAVGSPMHQMVETIFQIYPTISKRGNRTRIYCAYLAAACLLGISEDEAQANATLVEAKRLAARALIEAYNESQPVRKSLGSASDSGSAMPPWVIIARASQKHQK